MISSIKADDKSLKNCRIFGINQKRIRKVNLDKHENEKQSTVSIAVKPK